MFNIFYGAKVHGRKNLGMKTPNNNNNSNGNNNNEWIAHRKKMNTLNKLNKFKNKLIMYRLSRKWNCQNGGWAKVAILLITRLNYWESLNRFNLPMSYVCAMCTAQYTQALRCYKLRTVSTVWIPHHSHINCTMKWISPAFFACLVAIDSLGKKSNKHYAGIGKQKSNYFPYFV